MRLAFSGPFFLAVAACGTLGPPAAPPSPGATYVVIFPKAKLSIGREAAMVINRAAADANLHATKRVRVAGPPVIATPGYNPGLAAPRIQAVERALIAAGVDETRIVRGSLSAEISRAGANGAQRVEIHLLDNAPDRPRRKRH
jgi:hypothetical protein